MKIIRTDTRVMYIADNGKKVKFVGDKNLYSEISLAIENDREVEEVDDANEL